MPSTIRIIKMSCSLLSAFMTRNAASFSVFFIRRLRIRLSDGTFLPLSTTKKTFFGFAKNIMIILERTAKFRHRKTPKDPLLGRVLPMAREYSFLYYILLRTFCEDDM